MSAVDDSNPSPTPVAPAPSDIGAAEDERGLGPFVMTIFVIANLFVWTAILTPVAITLALKVRVLDPVGASTSLSIVAALGAVFAIVANPVFGRLSDRTRSRFGMRRPWMLAGVTFAAGGFVIISAATTIPGLVLGWIVAQLSIQALVASMTAVLPDHVPMRRRARVGGLIGMGQNAATTVGSGLLALNPTSLTWGFLAPIALACIGVVVFCIVLPDRRHNGEPRPPLSVKEIASSFWSSPRRFPDFAWMWLSRLLVFMGITIMIVYQAYFLLSRIGVPPQQIAAVMFGVLLLENVISILTNLLSGWVSDRLLRRKVFVAAAALIGSVGFLVAGFSTTMPVFIAGVSLLGMAKGIYVAVDLALATDLLPRGKQDAAKNMGLFTIASLLPNLLAPAIAPLLLSLGSAGEPATPGIPAGNYSALFVASGIFMLLGALAVRPIRSVR